MSVGITRDLRVFWSETRGVDCTVNNQTPFQELLELALTELQTHEPESFVDDQSQWSIFVEYSDPGLYIYFYKFIGYSFSFY